MENIKLEAQVRDKKESVKKLLAEGFVPAVVYGSHLKENKNLKVKAITIERLLEKAGESTLIDLMIGEEKPRKILIKDYQNHPTKNTLIHIDFYEVDMKKEIHAQVALNFIGESKAVKELGGVLIKNMDEIEVKCLPEKLVNHIDVDISSLETFDDTIKLSGVKLPEGIKLAHEMDVVVVSAAPLVEEKEEVVAAPVAAETEVKAEEGAENKTEAKETESAEKKK